MSTASTAKLPELDMARIGPRQPGAALLVWTALLLAVAFGATELRLRHYRDEWALAQIRRLLRR